jgi:hypothetical protein
LIAGAVRAALHAAALRRLRSGVDGVREGDLTNAVTERLETAAGNLSRSNAHSLLPDLPDDQKVVRVERPTRPRRSSRNYVRIEI